MSASPESTRKPRKAPTIAEPEMFQGITLMHLHVENFRRIRYVDITFDRELTIVGGDNGQGKTSLLMAVHDSLKDKRAVQPNPIHEGKNQAFVKNDFGDGKDVMLSVSTTFNRVGDQDFVREIEIEVPGHIPPSKTQDFLDKLFGDLSFDPMTFTHKMKGSQRIAEFQKFSDFNFTKNAKDRKAIFDHRTRVNADRDREQAAADNIFVEPKAPAEKIDEVALIQDLRGAGEHNTRLEQRRQRRRDVSDSILRDRQEAKSVVDNADLSVAAARERSRQSVSAMEEQIRALEKQIAGESDRLQTELNGITDAAVKSAMEITARADANQKLLDEAEALPEEINAEEIEAKLTSARETNRLVNEWEQQSNLRKQYQEKADAFLAESEDLTAEIAALDEAKNSAIRKAHLPIDGLGFGEEDITLNNLPWTSASEAEQFEAAVAIAMALNPKIQFVLIRSGSGIGSEIKERLRQRARERGYNIVMEVLDESGHNSHVYMKDGAVAQPKAAAEQSVQ